jgi:hypothetical protein
VVTVVVYETGPLELSEGVVDFLLRRRHLPGQDKGNSSVSSKRVCGSANTTIECGAAPEHDGKAVAKEVTQTKLL